MATSQPRQKRLTLTSVLAVVVVVGAGIGIVRARQNYQQHEDAANFAVKYQGLGSEWIAIPHGPQTLFLYKHKLNHVLLRGAVNQIIADYNPTPDLRTEAIADFYIDRTKENMPEWSAAKMDMVDAKGTAFRLISRTKKDKRVVTAYAVKGNTTLMVSLSGNANELAAVEEDLSPFRKFLGTVELVETDMSRL